MTFSTTLTIVIIGYILIYVVMIAYDMFLKKEITDFVPKIEDEDVDISDEVGSFKPILVEKEQKKENLHRQPDNDITHNAREPTQGIKDAKSSKDEEADKKDIGMDEKAEEKIVMPSVDEEDDQPSNRKPLSEKSSSKESEVQAEDNSTAKTDIEKSGNETDSIGGNAPKLEIDVIFDNEELAMELDFLDERLPYVCIDFDKGHTKMSGAIKAEELVERVNDLSEKGADSEFGKIVADWEVYEREKDKDGYEELKLLMADNTNCSGPPPMLDLS